MRAKRMPRRLGRTERAISVLASPGNVLDQDVAVGEQRDEHELERVALADDRALDLVEDASGERADLVEARV